MRVLVVGSSGRLGSAVVRALTAPGHDHEVVEASRSGQVRVDIRDPESIAAMYESVGSVDAVACCAGGAPMGPLAGLGYADLLAGATNKLLGQAELVRRGLPKVSDGGSFTLVGGVTDYDPVAGGSLLSMVNSGINGFVRGAAVDLPRGLRINAVSATLFAEAAEAFGPAFPGFVPVPADLVAQAYVKSIEGVQTGQVYRVGC